MKHLVWTLDYLANGFMHFMGWYFTLPIALSIVLVCSLVSFLRRSRKPVLIALMSLAVVYGAFAFCVWSNVEWKLYCYEHVRSVPRSCSVQ